MFFYFSLSALQLLRYMYIQYEYIYFLLQSFVLAIPALRKVCCCHQCEGGQESAFHYDNGDLKESDTTIRKRKSKSEAWAAKEKKIKSKNNNNQRRTGS